jgi:hypothetical protein
MRIRRLLGKGPDDPEETEAEVEATTEDAEVEEPEEAADVVEDEVTDEAEDVVEEGEERDDDQIAFELADWGARERKMIDDQLGALRVPRAWEASTLVVAVRDSEVVDDLIDEIEERLALDLSHDVEPVIYDVGDWPEGLEERFIEALIAERVPHERGYRAVTVGIDDEERVDGIVEQVSQAWEDEQVPDAEVDGPDAQDVLSELFVSSDRLLHDPSDRPATVRFDDAAASVEAMDLPFGFVADDWEAVTTRVAALRDLLSAAESTDTEIIESATDLRTQLRPLV